MNKLISANPEHSIKILNALHDQNEGLCKKICSARDMVKKIKPPEDWGDEYHKRVVAYLSAVQMVKTEMMISAYHDREEYFSGLVTIDTYYQGKIDALDGLMEGLTEMINKYEEDHEGL